MCCVEQCSTTAAYVFHISEYINMLVAFRVLYYGMRIKYIKGYYNLFNTLYLNAAIEIVEVGDVR